MGPAAPIQHPLRSDWLLALAACGLLLVVVRPFWGLTVDDALISFRYAQNWVAGCGPVFSCGEQPVEGYTNFLWVALAALAQLAKLPLLTTMHLLGLLCAAATVVLGARLARRLFDAPMAGAALALGLACSPFFAVNAVVALETSAATLSVIAGVYLSLDLPRRRPAAAGVAWAISYMVRPEGLAFAFITGLYALTRGLTLPPMGGAGGFLRGRLWPTVRGCLRYAAGFVAVAGPYFLWRALYYASLFPNTYYAKKGKLSLVVPHNLGLLWKHPVFWVALGLGALTALALRRRGAVLYTLLIALASAGISLTVYNNWWMPGHRLYMTAAALLAVLAGGVITAGVRSSFWLARVSGPALALALLAALWSSTWRHSEEIHKEAEQHYAREGHPAEKMGQRIKKLARQGDWLVIRDAGFIPYFAGSKLKVLDMHDHSLNDRRIARQGWNLDYIMRRKPRFIVFASYNPRFMALVHPSEGRIQRHPDFKLYRQIMKVKWHAARHYYLFERRAQPAKRPTQPKAPTRPKAAPAMQPKAKPGRPAIRVKPTRVRPKRLKPARLKPTRLKPTRPKTRPKRTR
jgi:arabinofuranosyltransferase